MFLRKLQLVPWKRDGLHGALTIAALAAVVISTAAIVLPFLERGFPSGHDASAHITYTYLFDRALGQGQFPVRWVEWVRPGESQPLFNFYYPGLYYLVELVHLVVPSLSVALQTTIVLLSLSGALFTFAFLKRFGALPAALAAAVFALAPYLALDLFVRAAYAEYAAVSLAPGVLWSFDRLLRSGRMAHVPAAAMIGGLMLITHLPSVLAFGPVVAGYVVMLLATRQTSAGRVGLLALASLLGVGMAAFYVVPALAELPFVTMHKMTSGYFDYRRHFVEASQWIERSWGYGSSIDGPNDNMSFQLGIVQCAAIVTALGVLATAFFERRLVPAARYLAFWLGAVALALFLATAASDAVWASIKPLSYLQFPWRCLMLVPLACAAMAACLLSLVQRRAVQALIVIGVVAIQYQVAHPHFRPLRQIDTGAMNIANPGWGDTATARRTAFIDRGFTPATARWLAPRGIGRWSARGEGDVNEVAVADDRLMLDVRTSAGMVLNVNAHMFPGWQITLDGAPADVDVERGSGYMRVRIPAGTHRVDARFTDTPVRRAANLASSVSIAMCVMMAAWYLWPTRASSRDDAVPELSAPIGARSEI